MKKIASIAVIVSCIYTSVNAADFSFGISGSNRGIDGFSLSIVDYYHAPIDEVRVIRRSVPREEMSVVYHLAHKSRRSPRYISNLRLRGSSWWDISLRLGIDPHILFVLNDKRNYGAPYGHYKHRKRRLRDREIIDLVNTRFIANYHQVSPNEIRNRRRSGERYMNIDGYYRSKKLQQREEREYKKYNSKNDKRNGRGKGKGKQGKKERYDRY